MKNTIVFFLILSAFLYACNKETQSLQEKVSISGSIWVKSNDADDPNEQPLAGVSVKLLQDGEVIQRMEDASFKFENLEAGRNYTIVPEKVDDVLHGISSSDISTFESYLDGNSTLNIRQLVAADMDRNLFVNQNDLSTLKECIQTPMMNKCLDWRFVHAKCQTMDEDEFINEIHFPALNKDQTEIKIFAIKSGDLAG